MTTHSFGKGISESTRGIAEKYRFRPKEEGLSDIEEYDTCEKNLLSKMGEGKEGLCDRKDFAWQMDLDMEALCDNADKIDEIRSELCEVLGWMWMMQERMKEGTYPDVDHWLVGAYKAATENMEQIIAKFGAQHLIIPDGEEDKVDPKVIVVEVSEEDGTDLIGN